MPVVTTLSGELISVDLTTRDFEGFRSDVLSSGGLADLYTPDWSDRSAFDLGVAMVEALALMCDNLSYYQDRMANEALFPSAVQRRSVIEHCKLLGYELRPAVSAQVLLDITSNALAVPGNDTLPIGTSFTVDTTDGTVAVTFELIEETTFSGVETKQVYAYEGTSYQEIVGSSTGRASQSFTLLRKPLALNSATTSSLMLEIYSSGSWIVWTEVDNFLLSSSTDTDYRVEIDENDTVRVFFGDDVNGAVPSSGSSNIRATYRVGGGHKGNEVAAGKITTLNGSYNFISAVINAASPNGGMDKETIAEAKVNAPLSLRAMERCVTHDDYIAKAKEVPGVKHAFASRGNGAYEERVVIATAGDNPVPSGSWDPYYPDLRTGLIGAVGWYLESRKTTPVILTVEPVRVLEVYLSLRVFCESNVRTLSIKRQVEDVVSALFDPDNETLGQQFPLSKVYEVVENISGVKYADVVQLQRYPNPRQINGSESDLIFENFLVSSNAESDTYRVEFYSDTEFTVTSLKYGYQGSGVIGTAFLSTDSRLAFTIQSGSIVPTNAVKFDIKTSSYISNIDPEYDELVILMNSTFQLTLSGGLA
jgi:hypothetical protein